MINVPKGYTLLEHGPTTIVVKQSYKDRLIKQGIDNPDILINSSLDRIDHHQGRGFVPSVPIEGLEDEKMVIRKYLRGGFFRFVNHDIYLGLNRPFRELYITAKASLKGVPSSEVLAAVSVKVLGPFYRIYLITKELPSCKDLPSYLSTLAYDSEETFHKEKETILKRVAETIRQMHDLGFIHADLNLKNILIDFLNPQNIFIIDWDKSRLKDSLTSSERSANVRRFCRSMAKLTNHGLSLTKKDPIIFLKAYWQSDKAVEQKIKKDLFLLRLSLSIRSVFWKILPKK